MNILIYILQLGNILALLGMLIIPFLIGFYFVKKIKMKSEDKEDIEIRVALLEKKVKDLEDYINDSDH